MFTIVACLLSFLIGCVYLPAGIALLILAAVIDIGGSMEL